ncbi:MAG: hypothetical protein ACI8Y7_000135 [Candidatus Woesearchaeota archaeon]|jgi:hypothetical protein
MDLWITHTKVENMDLTKKPPRSPRTRLHGYVIAARMIDKLRATIAKTNGEYHYACPVDQVFLKHKKIDPEKLKEYVKENKSTDSQIMQWMDENGAVDTVDERLIWSQEQDMTFPMKSGIKEYMDWYVGFCAESGIDPQTSTQFDSLDIDDEKSFSS